MNVFLYAPLARCFDKENKKLTDIGTDILLVIAVFSSWFLFPVMLKFLAYTAFQVGVLIISTSVLALLIRYAKLNQLEWTGWHQWFICLWIIYLLFLGIATVHSGSMYSLKEYCIILYKVMFFTILLFYMKRNLIVWSFRLYSNLMVLIVLLSILVSAGVFLNVIEPIQKLTDIVAEQGYKFSVYWGAYYNLGTIYYTNNHIYPVFRMQGFCEEAGTFAFALLPALYWFLIAEKSIVCVLIISVGLLASFSKGGVIALFLLLPLFIKKSQFNSDRLMLSLIAVISVSGVCLLYYFFPYYFNIQTLLSAGTRLEPVLKSFAYLPTHPFGTGAALGMDAIHFWNIGYANAMVEAGYLGGIAYCAMFGLLGWQALKVAWSADMSQNEGRVRFVVSVAVMLVLFMGAQRQAPDLSLWHMWIYASFFYLTMKKKDDLTTCLRVTHRQAEHAEKSLG